MPPSTELAVPSYVETGLSTNSAVFAEYTSPEALALVLHDDADLQVAANIVNDIRVRAKALEELEKSVTRPILEGVERYRALFRPRRAEAARARVLWDDKIRVFHTARAAAQAAAQAALQDAITTGDLPAAAAAVTALVPAAKTEGLTVVDTWTFEEKNHDIVPTSLTVLDPVAVRAEIKRQVAAGDTPAIPGLRVFKTQVVRAAGG